MFVKRRAALVVLGLWTFIAACGDDTQPGGGGSSTNSGGAGGQPGDGGGGQPPNGAGGEGGMTTIDGGGGQGGGEGGSGGQIMPTEPGPPGNALVSAGDYVSSENYSLVFTMGQSTINQNKMSSQNYRLQGGLIGATGSLP